ncbi:MAG TPA: GH116 family glycosyl hydrolase [Pyrinomonadaceae bacterium]|nr:GH116 family glycosyl hydrolase [Pyrinomonadaceae bacterium]
MTALCLILIQLPFAARAAQTGAPTQTPALTPKFPFETTGLALRRRTRPGAFLDVLGRKAAVFGYEHGRLEAWAYPLQILDDLELSFRLEGYPLELKGADTSATLEARPEATVVTYSHAAFTVRQTIFAPLDEPGVVMLFDVDSALPLTISVSFRPRLKLMWPAGLMTGSLSWDKGARAYFITEETGRFAGVIGSPAARDVSVQPYQEEPRDVPAQFRLEVPPAELKTSFVPVVIAGSVRGRGDAAATYARLLDSARGLYEKNVEHYRRLLEETTTVTTPDARVNEALQWAKVGIDKGVVENPLLGRGLVAGFRTAGESERPGFAWFFGRDSLWTALALNSYGDFATTRDALSFLKKFQRADGKVPHEISQSASLIPWFTDYPYPWASADATPLYIIAHADYLRASGDVNFIRADWDSLLKAYRFTKATDTDNNGLIENDKFGHGWVEGGALYPPREEIYMQGLWVEALRGMEEMATALGEEEIDRRDKLEDETGDILEGHAAARAEAVRETVEKTYWLGERGFYAFATNTPRDSPREADPGPSRDARQKRMNELDRLKLIDEDTVMPAVPLWFGVLEDERAQGEIDHLGSGHMATDWGARIVNDESRLYDPLSYHNGSVWPLFTGWASMGAYRYGRPHVGLQALMSNVLLRRQNALGYVTELLSGDFNAPFGRSSHHQVWSEAMTVTPLLRGLLGVEVEDAGKTVKFSPQLPADWNSVEVRRVAAGASTLDFSLARGGGLLTIKVRLNDREARASKTVGLAPAFPGDAAVRSVKADGRAIPFHVEHLGGQQFVVASVEVRRETTVPVAYDEGSDVYLAREPPAPGARSDTLRVLRSEAEPGALRLLLEGRGGRPYTLKLKTPHTPAAGEGFAVTPAGPNEYTLTLTFGPASEGYTRREFVIPLKKRVLGSGF